MTNQEAMQLSHSMGQVSLPGIKRQIARELFDYYKDLLSPQRLQIQTTRRMPANLGSWNGAA